ncbi:isocitrate/isopropylmalate family dehydrogenase, partial [Staphylococcus coagulans]
GGASIDTFGEPLTEKTLNACKRADAILLGAIGGPKWTDPNNRPEQGLLKLRKSLNLFANIRPTTVVKGASSLSPLKEERVEGTDLVIVRELTSGIYFGEPRHFNNHEALDSLTYTREEIERIVHVAFKLAASRRTEEEILVMEEALDEMNGAIERHQSGEEADLKFHLAIAKASD